MNSTGLQASKGVSDLSGKMEFRAISWGNAPGTSYVHRQDAVRSTLGLPVDSSIGIICDQIIALTGVITHRDYPEHLRRIRLKDPKTGKTVVFLINNFALPAAAIICALYKRRWQVELFFKPVLSNVEGWIKQHLRIKKFYGNAENTVKSQIWIAISIYVLVAIVKKRLNLDASLYTLLQILSLTLFEKISLQPTFTGGDYKSTQGADSNQMNLFEF